MRIISVLIIYLSMMGITCGHIRSADLSTSSLAARSQDPPPLSVRDPDILNQKILLLEGAIVHKGDFYQIFHKTRIIYSQCVLWEDFTMQVEDAETVRVLVFKCSNDGHFDRTWCVGLQAKNNKLVTIFEVNDSRLVVKKIHDEKIHFGLGLQDNASTYDFVWDHQKHTFIQSK